MEGLFFLFWVNVLILFAVFSAIYCSSGGACRGGSEGGGESAPSRYAGGLAATAFSGVLGSNERAPTGGDSASTATPAKKTLQRENDEWRAYLINRLGRYTMELGDADVLRDDESSNRGGLRVVAEPPSAPPLHAGDNAGDAPVPDVEMGVAGGVSRVVDSYSLSPDPLVGVEAGASVQKQSRRRRSSDLHDNDDGAGGSRALLSVPRAGCSCEDASLQGQDRDPSDRRLVSSLCAVCLSSMDTSQSVTWSSNKSCQHVFHASCILEWLEESGRKELKRLRRQNQNVPDLDSGNEAIRCSAPCPCCRQEFILPD